MSNIDQRNQQVQNQTNTAGDLVQGDKVGHDKVGRDKVMGDQYQYHYHQGTRPEAADPATLAEAEGLLAELPTDRVPGVGHLPVGSRVVHRVNPLFVGREQELMALAVGG